MRRYKGTFDLFFGIEDGGGSSKEPRKGGGSQPTRQGQPTQMEEVRIASTRREESSWQSTATWEQLLTKEKDPLRQEE